jgi:hypothetical protein
MELTIVAEIGEMLTPLVGAVAAGVALWQYAMQNSQKRAEMFFKWNEWFDSKDGFGIDSESKNPSILHLLQHDDPRLKDVPWETKEKLLAFYEELALAVNSGLLSEATANYMFGYYAVKIRKNEKYFWTEDLGDPKAGYWKLLNHFTDRIEAKQKELDRDDFKPTSLKF